MASQKIKLCASCKNPFKGRVDAKTCSSACRKRLQRLQAKLRTKVYRLESELGQEFHKVASKLFAQHAVHAPLLLSDERGSIQAYAPPAPQPAYEPVHQPPPVVEVEPEPIVQPLAAPPAEPITLETQEQLEAIAQPEVVPVQVTPAVPQTIIPEAAANPSEAIELEELPPEMKITTASTPEVVSLQPRSFSLLKFNKSALAISSVVVVVLLITTVAGILAITSSNKSKLASGSGQSANYAVGDLSVSDVAQGELLGTGKLETLTINGKLKVTNSLVLSGTTAPEAPVAGQIYFDSAANTPFYFDGTRFVSLAPTAIPQSVTSLGGAAGVVGLGNSLSIVNNQLNIAANLLQNINSSINTPRVNSLQGLTGNVALIAGSGIAINGTTISNNGVISLASGSADITVLNDGNGHYTVSVTGSGGGGTVALGPVATQVDPTNSSSINVNKTGTGNFLQFANNGSDTFVVNQSGQITTGTINYSQVQGVPAFVSSIAGNNGAFTLGTGLGNTGNTLTNTGVVSITGTANQIIASASSGALTLSLPQNIGVTSAPTFGALTLGAQAASNGVLQLANNTNSYFASLQTTALGQDTIYTLPDPGIANVTICLSTGNCAGSGSGITGSGTSGRIAKFNGSGTITNSNLNETGTTLTYGGNSVINAGLGFIGNLLNLQVDGSSKLSVNELGDLTQAGTLNVNGTGSSSIAGSLSVGTGLVVNGGGLTVNGGVTVVTGGISVDGSVTLSDLGLGIVQSDASGLLTSGSVDRNNSAYFSNTLTAANGGTGAGSFTTNGLLYGNGTGTLQATSSLANAILVTDGSSVPSLSQTLPAAVQGNITGTGILASGSIASGFGAISTGNTIGTTGALEGGTLAISGANFTVDSSGNVVAAGTITSGLINNQTISSSANFTGTLTVQGSTLTIGVPGTTTGNINLANSTSTRQVILQGLNPSGTGNATIQIPTIAGGATDIVCLVALGNCAGSGGGITGSGTSGKIAKFNGTGSITDSILTEAGSVVTATGTLNATTALQLNGADINTAGTLTNVAYENQANNFTLANTFSAAGTALSVTSNASIGGTLVVGGTVTFSGLNSAGVVHTDGSGILSTGAVILGSETSGDYVANLGTLTGLSTSGNSGAGSTPSLSVTYGSLAATAVQGNTTITCSSGAGNLSGGGDMITLGSGGSCSNISISSSPTFSGQVAIQGANSLTLGTASTNTGAIAFKNSTNANTVTLQSGASASNFTLTLPTTPGSNGDCLQTNGSGVLSFTACTGGTGGGVTSLNGEIGVLTLANASGSTGTITINDASTAQKGIAQFNSTNFTDNGSGIINTIQDISTTATPTFGGLTLTSALTVANGGTGAGSFTANGILYGNGTSAIQATSAAANSILATDGSNVPGLTQTLPAAVQGNITGTGILTGGSIASGFGTIVTANNITTTATVQGGTLNGTSAIQLNGVNINTAGTLTNVAYLNQANNFSASQTISANGGLTTLALTSTGTNTGITFGGDTAFYRAGASQLRTGGQLQAQLLIAANLSGAGQVRIGNVGPGATAGIDFGSATDTNLYRSAANTLKTDDDLVVTGTITSGLINNQTISSSANFTGTLTVQGSTLTIGVPGTTTGNINLANSTSTRQVILQGLNPSGTGNATIQIPTIAGGATDIVCLVALGNCAGSGGGITGSGTSGKIAKFNGTGSITDSILTEAGSVVTASGQVAIQGANSLTLGTASTNTGAIAFKNSTNANTVTLQSGASASNFTLTLPTTPGSNGDCLQTNGSGVLSFTACTGGTGGGVTSLNGEIGVLTLANASGSTGTITINDASTAQKGIAQFNSTNFTDNGSGIINTIQDISTTATPTFGGLTLTSALTVANGGTGAGSFTANGILYGNGTSAIQATSAAANSILATDGSNVPGLTQTLPAAVQGNITGTGILTGGSIASGFGTIVTANNITTTATVQGGTLNGTSAIQLNGVNINTAGTLTNVAYLNQANNFTLANTFSAAGTALSVTHNASIGGTLAVTGVSTFTGAIIANGGITLGAAATLVSTSSGVGVGIISLRQSGDTNYRLTIRNSGTMLWGDGTNAADTNLYRGSADLLKTDDSFAAVGNIYAGHGTTDQIRLNNNGQIQFGSGADTNLYRSAADTLKTDDAFVVTGAITGSSTIQGTSVNGTTGINTGAAGGTQRIDASGNLVNIGTITSGLINNQTISSSANFTGTLTVQGSTLTIGVPGTTTGNINLANSTSTRQVILQGLNPSGTGNATIQIPTIAGGATDIVCLVALGNCAGSGGGITGSGTSGKIAKFNGTGSITDSILTEAGSVVTATGTLNATTALQLNGADINTAGTLTNVAYENQANNFTLANTFSAAGTALSVTSNASIGGTLVVGGTVTSGLINNQTISSAANFTGTLAVASTSSFGNAITVTGPLTTTTTTGQKDARIVLRNNSFTGGAGGEVVLGAIADTNIGRYASIGTDILTNSVGGAAGNVYIATKSLSADTSLTKRLVVASTGEVSIGPTVVSGGAALQVAGAITGSSTVTGTTINGTTGINTGASAGTQRIDASGNLVNIGTITSGLINNQTISSSANFTGTLAVTGAITGSSTIQGTSVNGTTGINTGAAGGTQRIDASGNLVNIGTITSGLINNQTISSSANFTGTLTVQGSTLTIGVPGTTTGNINLANSTSTRQVILQGLNPSGTGNATIQIPTIAGGATDIVCLVALGNCAGSGGGITGSGTSGKIAKFNGTGSITDSNLSESGTVLTYSGNQIINTANGFTGNILNLLVNSSSKLSVNEAGNTIQAGTLTVNGGGASSIAGSLSVGTGLTVTSGATTLGGTLSVTSTSTLTGNVGIGSAPSTDSKLFVISTVNDPTTAQYANYSSLGVVQTTSNANGYYGVRGGVNVTGSGNSTGVIAGLYGLGQYSASGVAGNVNGAVTIGIQGATGGGITTLRGLYAQAQNLSTTTAVTVGVGIEVGAPISSGGNFTDYRGLIVRSATSGVTGPNYGIQVSAPVGGSANAAIYLSDTGGTAAGGLLFATDTNLYRSAANTLKTDDKLVVQNTETSVAGGSFVNLNSSLTVAPSSALSLASDYTGTYGYVTSGSANTAASTRLFGSVGHSNYIGSGTLGTLLGVRGRTNNTSTGTVNAAVALDAYIDNTSTGTIQSAYGLLVEPFVNSGGGTIQNAYGIYVSDQSAATNNYGLYFAGTSGTPRSGISWNGDTNLYRSAANTLKTDDALVVGGNLTVNTNTFVGSWTGLSSYAAFGHQSVSGAALSYALLQDSIGNTFLNAATTQTLALRINNTSVVDITSTIVAVKSTGKTALTIADSGAQTSGLTIGGDTNLYRSAANTLKTDGSLTVTSSVQTLNGILWATRSTTGLDALRVQINGEAVSRLAVTSNAVLNFSDGTNAADTNLYRSAADTLKTDDAFTVAGATTLQSTLGVTGNLTVSTGSTLSLWNGINNNQILLGYNGANYQHAIRTVHNGGVASGNLIDFNIWTPADAAGTVGTLLAARLTGAGQLQLPTTGSAAGLLLGGDANLYRSAANALKTDDALTVAGATILQSTAAITGSTTIGGALTVAGDGTFGNVVSTTGTAYSGFRATTYSSVASYVSPIQLFNRARGTALSPSGVLANDTLGSIGFRGHDGTAMSIQDTARISAVAESDFDGSNWSGYLAFSTSASGTSGAVERLRVTGAGQLQSRVTGSTGGLSFGSGATQDTNLYRDSANVLKTDDALTVAGAATLQGTAAISGNTTISAAGGTSTLALTSTGTNTGITFGGDATFYRAAAAQLRSNSQIQSLLLVAANLSGAGQVLIGNVGPGSLAGITFGSASDTSLYRLTTDILATDDRLLVTRATTGDIGLSARATGDTLDRFDVTAGGTLQFGSGSAALDTNLYRSAVDTLKTDDAFVVVGATALQGSLTVGVAGSTAGVINLANSTNTNLSRIQATAPSGTGTATYSLPAIAGGGSDEICLLTLSNCSPVGSPSGDLTGTYPSPTIAKLQGTTLTLSSLSSSDVLQYNGSAIVNGKIANANLQAGTFASITGTGALAVGSIASGFGTISTGNNITTSATIQGSTLVASSYVSTPQVVGGTTLTLQSSGTSAISLGANATAHTTTVGTTNTTATTIIQSGSGGITLTGTVSGNSDITANSGTAAQIQLTNFFGAPFISFGTVILDTYLFSPGAGQLSTNSQIYIGGSIQAGADVVNGSTTTDIFGTKTNYAVCHSGSTGTVDDVLLVDCTSVPVADYAEMYPTEPGIGKGDLVMLGSNYAVTTTKGEKLQKLTKTSGAYAAGMLGIISDPNDASDFNVIGYNIADEDNPRAMALNGRVTTKVNNEGGAIHAGDLITSSSTPGVGMKANLNQAGMVVGVALADFEGSGQGEVLVFVNPYYYQPSQTGILQSGEFSDLDVQGTTTLNNLQVSGTADFANLNASGLATINDLHVIGSASIANLTVTGTAHINELTVTGLAHFQDITIAGHIITAGDAPTKEVLGAAGSSAVVEVRGNDTLGTVTITTGSAPTAGDLAKIIFSKDYGLPPRVLLSPANDKGAELRFYRGATDANHFMLASSTVPQANTTYVFDYFIGQSSD